MKSDDADPEQVGLQSQRWPPHTERRDPRAFVVLLVFVLALGLSTAAYVAALTNASDDTQEWLYLSAATVFTGLVLFTLYRVLRSFAKWTSLSE